LKPDKSNLNIMPGKKIRRLDVWISASVPIGHLRKEMTFFAIAARSRAQTGLQ